MVQRARPELLQNARFGVAARIDRVDLDGARLKRTTIGFQIRPTTFTVFKFDRELNDQGGTNAEIDDDAWRFSFGILFYR